MVDGDAHALPQLDVDRAPLPPYRRPAWLRGGHAQTIWPYLLPRPAVRYRRERVETPDGDFWDFDWLDARDASRAPLVALFHGLEGSSDSHYARALMAVLAARGWRGVIPHFRGCSGEPNRLPRAYHSGDHAEFELQIAAIRARIPPATPLYLVGVSVGGSVLVNWLGRKKNDALSVVTAAAAVSTPLDLESAGIAIGKGANRISTRPSRRCCTASAAQPTIGGVRPASHGSRASPYPLSCSTRRTIRSCRGNRCRGPTK